MSRARSSWLRFWGAMRRYHRYEVEGLEHLDGGEARLIVGYHGRPLATDLCILSTVLYERLGYLPHGVMHRGFSARGLAELIDALGFVTGDGPALEAAAQRGEHIVVVPGGTREGCRSFRHRYEIDWGGRTGYLRLARRLGLKIVPTACHGVDDLYWGLNDGYRLGRRVGMPSGMPLWFGVGLTGMWPVALPFPVKLRQKIGAPIDPGAPGDDPEAADAAVRSAIARLLPRRRGRLRES